MSVPTAGQPVVANSQAKAPADEEGFYQQVRRHQTRNIAVFFAEGLTSSFSWGFLETPAFAAYLLALGCSPLMITATTSAYLFAWYVPMVLFVPLVQRRAERVGSMIRWAGCCRSSPSLPG